MHIFPSSQPPMSATTTTTSLTIASYPDALLIRSATATVLSIKTAATQESRMLPILFLRVVVLFLGIDQGIDR